MSRGATIAIAAAWGLVVAVLLYGAVRAIQYFVFPEPNPATVVWTAHSGYFWRIWIVAFAGGIASWMAGVIVVQTASGRIERYDVLGWVVAGAMVLTMVLMYNVNTMIHKPRPESLPSRS